MRLSLAPKLNPENIHKSGDIKAGMDIKSDFIIADLCFRLQKTPEEIGAMRWRDFEMLLAYLVAQKEIEEMKRKK